MKKIFVLLTMLLIGMSVSAQIVDTGKRYELHIGKYVLSGSDHKDWGLEYGVLEYRSEYADDVDALGKFIDTHKQQLEKKYNIVIDNYVYGRIKEDDYRVMIVAYSPSQWRKLQDIKSKEERERSERISSLNNIL
jgi:hypothetical protein